MQPIQPVIKGRGASHNPPNRFEKMHLELVTDERTDDEPPPTPETEYFRDSSRSIIVSNDSPDVFFDKSIKFYRGCVHGCIYCRIHPPFLLSSYNPRRFLGCLTMEQLISTPERDIRFEGIERPFDFRSPFDGRDFVLMLVVDDTSITDEEQSHLSSQIIQEGCRYAVCAGHRCSTWDDSIEWALLSRYPDFNPPDERFVMTSWHDNETLDDVVFFFLNHTSFNHFQAERFLIYFVGRNVEAEREVKTLVFQS
jgi:hypothetical protein